MKIAKVLFVAFSGLRIKNPKLLALGWKSPELRHRSYTISSLPSLGLLTLAGLTPDTWQCKYIEYSEDSIDEIKSYNPDLIAISSLTATIQSAISFSCSLRSMGMKTVLGGLHATSLFEELKNDFDSIVIGDGESSWLQVIEDCTNESLKKFYYSNKSYELISTPLPRWDLLGDKKRARYTVQTQRGCSKACSFCGASRLLGPLRFKAAEAIQKELEHLKLHTNAYMIELADDNTFVDVGARPELFDVLEDAQIQYFTEAEWIIGENPEILDRLASSGCVQVLVGIESFSGKYKGMGSKTAQIERIFGAIDAIQDSGVSVIACFIVGIDGETSQSIERLGDIILGSSISDVQITLQTPFPGTVLYQQLKSQNRLLKDKDWSHYTLFDVCYEPSHMTAQELEESFLKLMSRVYHKSESDKRKILRKKIWNRNKKN